MEIVLVGQLFTGGNSAHGGNVDAALFILLGFSIGITAVIEEHRCAEAVNDQIPSTGEQVGNEPAFIACDSLSLGHARPVVLADSNSCLDGPRGVATCGVDRRRANDKTWNHHDGLTIANTLCRPYEGCQMQPKEPTKRLN